MCSLRSLRVVLDNYGGYVFCNTDGEDMKHQCIKQYKNEHCATELEIELNDELTAGDISFYRLVFNVGSSLENRFDNKYESLKITADSTPHYVADGVIYFQLTDSLTAMSSLLVQVEAYTVNENEMIESIIKSAAFELNFERSVEGVTADIPGSTNGFITEFYNALDSMNSAVEEIDKLTDIVNNSLDNGDFNGSDATINGYNAVEITGSENITVTQEGNRIVIDDKESHTHKYSNTLDALRCPVLEDPLAQNIDDHYLKFNGSALRFVSDGAVVKRVSEVEKDGQAYLRLWLHDGRSLILGSEIPCYIDIPVSAVISTESEDDNGLILNGSELELPSGGANEFVPMQKINATAEEINILLPNKEYAFGECSALTINFAEGDLNSRNEYLFSFISGETATVLTLPSSVQWVNELTVEANKRYEISVVDNIALWCAVDYEVSE